MAARALFFWPATTPSLIIFGQKPGHSWCKRASLRVTPRQISTLMERYGHPPSAARPPATTHSPLDTCHKSASARVRLRPPTFARARPRSPGLAHKSEEVSYQGEEDCEADLLDVWNQPSPTDRLRVVSYNIAGGQGRLNEAWVGDGRRDALAARIRAVAPDVVALQEVRPSMVRGSTKLDGGVAELGYLSGLHYSHYVPALEEGDPSRPHWWEEEVRGAQSGSPHARVPVPAAACACAGLYRCPWPHVFSP
jgi:hypothetical protein